MTLWNCGEIILGETTDAERKDVVELFCDCVYARSNHSPDGKSQTVVTISDLPGYIEGTLGSLVQYCDENNIGIYADSYISYYGDYTGAYEWNESTHEFDNLGAEDLVIREASDAELAEELARRGYEVIKCEK